MRARVRKTQGRIEARLTGLPPDPSPEAAADGHFTEAEMRAAPPAELEPEDDEEPEE